MYRLPCARIFIVLLAASIAGCAAKLPPPPDDFRAAELDASAFTPAVGSFVVIVDASSSMSAEHQGLEKLVLAKRTVSHINQTLPELEMQGALVAFGSGSCLDDEDTKSLYGMAAYNPADLEAGLAALTCAGGTTPMDAALELAREKLADTTGKVAVLLVSDARPLREDRALAAARELHESFGDRLCLYPIQIATHEGGAVLMTEIAGIGDCGFATNADDIASPSAMSEFVTRVFLTPDPRARFETKRVVTRDGDRDGVRDALDRCPGTPGGVRVNAFGCWEFRGLTFEFDQAVIRNPGSLDEVIRILKARPEITGEVRGYTDSVGPADYNQRLSEARANAVRDHLVERGIDPGRIRAVGLGMNDPVASNDTEAGRSLNRRVELEPDR